MIDRFMFAKVTWQSHYRGELHDTTRYRNIMNGVGFEDDREGGEAYLFKAYRGTCYGYVHLGRTDPDDDDTIRTIDLRRLGGSSHSDVVRNVHVIWIAARVDAPGICVVGDYRNADVYRSAQPAVGGRPWSWNIAARTDHVRVIPEAERIDLDGVPLRQGNLWYARGLADARVRRAALGHLSRRGRAVAEVSQRHKRAG